MLFRLRRLEGDSPHFHELCEGLHYTSRKIPRDYLSKGDCHVIIKKGNVVGGFCIVDAPPLHLHAISTIPDIVHHWYMYDDILYNPAEITGTFRKDGCSGTLLALYIAWVILFHRADQFVYSYPESQKDAALYSKIGGATRLFSGATLGTAGVSYVDILTKTGVLAVIFRLAVSQLIRRIRHGKRARQD